MDPSDRGRSTPDQKRYSNLKISNRGQAPSPHSEYKKPKISDRELSDSPVSEYIDPKISSRSNALPPVSEYNDPKISVRASSVFEPNNYDDRITERGNVVKDNSEYDTDISKRGLVLNNKRDAVAEYLSNSVSKVNPHPEYKGRAVSKVPNYNKEYKGPAIPRQPKYFKDNAKNIIENKIGKLDEKGKPSEVLKENIDYKDHISDRRIAMSKPVEYFRDTAKKIEENDVGLGYDGNGKPSYNMGPLKDVKEYEGRISDRRIAESKPNKFYHDTAKDRNMKENYVTVGKDMTNPNYNYILTDLGEDSEGKFVDHISDRRPAMTKRNSFEDKYASSKFDNSELYESMAPSYGEDGSLIDNMNLGELMNSNNLFSRDQINKKKYVAFNRFGVIDPYNGLQGTREYLFFTKPNLHIMNSGMYENDKISDNVLAKGIRDSSFFIDLYDRYPEVIFQLESGYTEEGYPNTPFMNLLSNSVTNTLDVPNITAREIETATNMYGTSINYRGSGYKSDEDIDLSLEFTDSKYGELYMLLRAYEEYSRLKDDGLVTPPDVGWNNRNMSKDDNYANEQFPFTRSHKYKELHDRFSIYKFIVDEDGETILFWAKYIGCYFNTVPRDAFSDLRDTNGLKYTVDIKCPFMRDMDPIDLNGFNNLIDRYKITKGEELGIWLPKSSSNGILEGKIDGRWASTPYITCKRQIDDGNPYPESYKWLAPRYMKYIYKLRWYL